MGTYTNALVLGRGFLGQEFEEHGYAVWDRHSFDWGRDHHPIPPNFFSGFETLINCIGVADTRACEHPDNWDSVFSVNSELPKALSAYCRNHNMKYVHISTGCVYDHNNSPQNESDFTSAHCKYVISKLAAEYFCSSDDLILRPRLYFSYRENRNNLLTKIPQFQHYLTEINSYTSLQTIVEATTALLAAKQTGIFNVAQTNYASIQQICSHLGLPSKPTISGAALQQREEVALVNNILDLTKLQKYYQPRPLLEEISSCWQGLNLDREL